MEQPFKIPDEAKRRKIRFEEAPEENVYAEIEETAEGYAHFTVKTKLGDYQFWFSPEDGKVAYMVDNKAGSFGGTEKAKRI